MENIPIRTFNTWKDVDWSSQPLSTAYMYFEQGRMGTYNPLSGEHESFGAKEVDAYNAKLSKELRKDMKGDEHFIIQKVDRYLQDHGTKAVFYVQKSLQKAAEFVADRLKEKGYAVCLA